MDRLLSLFSVYDFFGYVLAGGSLIAGTYWAFAKLPHEPGTAAVFGIIALSYMSGHLVQSLATIWEGWLWSSRGIPSSVRLAAPSPSTSQPGKKTTAPRPYDSELQRVIKDRIAGITGTATISTEAMFAVARAELRARQLDGRAELMNTMYGLCRGLATSAALLIPVFVAAGFKTDDWTRLGIAIGTAVVACLLYARRAERYSYRFADQVWHDFVALRTEAPAGSGSPA
jgi:hypothetical protein